MNLVEISQKDPTGWRMWRLADEPVLDARVARCLMLDHGDDVTLGVLDRMPDERLLRSANIGSASLRKLRVMLDFWRDRENEKIDAAHKTVLWRDGDHGTEFITPEEYQSRIARRRTPDPEPVFAGALPTQEPSRLKWLEQLRWFLR